MVHSTARMHFGKVSEHVVKPIDWLNIKQEGMRHSLLCGESLRQMTDHQTTITMMHSSCLQCTDRYQECD